MTLKVIIHLDLIKVKFIKLLVQYMMKMVMIMRDIIKKVSIEKILIE